MEEISELYFVFISCDIGPSEQLSSNMINFCFLEMEPSIVIGINGGVNRRVILLEKIGVGVSGLYISNLLSNKSMEIVVRLAFEQLVKLGRAVCNK